MSASLKGRSIILTGAAGGHGKAIARLMAREGARLVLVDRDPSVAVVARSIKGEAWSFVLDVVDEGGWTPVAEHDVARAVVTVRHELNRFDRLHRSHLGTAG